MLPGMLGMAGFAGGAAGDAKSADFMGLVDEGVSVSFGAASASRRMVAVIHWLEGGTHFTLSSATIGGVAATLHAQGGHSGGVTGFGIAIISAAVPSGTSGVVDCTFSGAPSAVFCGVYRLVGLVSGTPTDIDQDEAVGTTSDKNVTITVADAGIVIAGFSGSTNANSSVSWTGVTEQYDDDPSIHRSSGFASGLAAQNLLVTADITPQVDSGNSMVVVSWS